MFTNPRPPRMPSGAYASPEAEELFIFVQWLHHLDSLGLEITGSNATNLGYPTANLNKKIISGAKDYLIMLQKYGQAAQKILAKLDKYDETQLEKCRKFDSLDNNLKAIIEELDNLALNFEATRTDPRTLLAKGFNDFYNPNKHPEFEIRRENVIPTIGGAGGLHNIFQTINKMYPDDYYITPLPRYILYSGFHNQNNLDFIDVMKESGYRLTPSALDKALHDGQQAAAEQGRRIHSILLCNPSNPTGTAVSNEEWKEIIKILAKEENKHLRIIIDEAYIEMTFDNEGLPSEKKHPSLLAYLSENFSKVSPEEQQNFLHILQNTYLSRSGTKDLSAAGIRPAAVIAFDKTFSEKLEQEINYSGPPSYSSQIAYANAISKQQGPDAGIKDKFYREHYHAQVQFMHSRLNKIGLDMKDPNYKVEGTFYIMADLSKFIGYKIEDSTINEKLGKSVLDYLNKDIGLNIENGILETDTQIAYYLACEYGIAITPLSFFKADARLGLFRITCSAGRSVLEILANKLEKAVRVVESTRVLLSTSSIHALASNAAKNNFVKESSVKFNSEPNVSSLYTDTFPLILNELYIQNLLKYWGEAEKKAELVQKEWVEHKKKSAEREEAIKKYFMLLAEYALNCLENGLRSEKEIQENKASFEHQAETCLTELLSLVMSPEKITEESVRNKSGIYFEEIRIFVYETIKWLCITYNTSFENDLWVSSVKNMNASQSFRNEESAEKIISFLQKFLKEYLEEANIEKVTKGFILDLIYQWIGHATVKDYGIPCAFLYYSMLKEQGLIFIEEIKRLGASIPYSDPEGGLQNRQKMAEALNRWHGFVSQNIKPEHLLFFGCNINALINKSFENNVIRFNFGLGFIGVQDKNKPFAIVLDTFNNKYHKPLSNAKVTYLLDELRKKLNENQHQNGYIIIDESLAELEFTDKENSLFKFLNTFDEFREKIILIRSATGVFSSYEEPIAVLMTFNKEIKERLFEDSFNIHIHPPTSLVNAYADTALQYVKQLSRRDKNTLAYQARLRKFFYIRNLKHITPDFLRTDSDDFTNNRSLASVDITPQNDNRSQSRTGINPSPLSPSDSATFFRTLQLPNCSVVLRGFTHSEHFDSPLQTITTESETVPQLDLNPMSPVIEETSNNPTFNLIMNEDTFSQTSSIELNINRSSVSTYKRKLRKPSIPTLPQNQNNNPNHMDNDSNAAKLTMDNLQDRQGSDVLQKSSEEDSSQVSKKSRLNENSREKTGSNTPQPLLMFNNIAPPFKQSGSTIVMTQYLRAKPKSPAVNSLADYDSSGNQQTDSSTNSIFNSSQSTPTLSYEASTIALSSDSSLTSSQTSSESGTPSLLSPTTDFSRNIHSLSSSAFLDNLYSTPILLSYNDKAQATKKQSAEISKQRKNSALHSNVKS